MLPKGRQEITGRIMSHKQGWKICFVAGLFPLTIGLMGYLTAFVMSIWLRPEEPVQVLWKTCSFSLKTVMEFDQEAGALFGVATLCFWQLLIVYGAMICTLSFFGLRAGQRWAWYFMCAALVWGAGNDTCAAIYLHVNDVMSIPTPFFVDGFGLAGLFFSRDIVRSGSQVSSPD